MEFWGVEVKPGQSLVVKPGFQKYLHLSQATIGETKKDKANENVTIFLKIGDQKLVLGILSAEKFPHLSFDLVFEKEFELSHNGKGGSVYCCGYQAFAEDQEHDDYLDSDSGSEDEELELLPPAQNGKPSQKEEEKSVAEKRNAAKSESTKKSDGKPLKPSKDEEDESDEDEDSDGESDEEMLEADSSDSDDEDDGTESDEETPKKVESTKKRLNESASKTTPLPAKKAKLVSPEKTDSKKGGHTATPHPAKKSAKTPTKSESPKSGGQFSCKPCNKSFGTDKALQSHSKAKHGGK
ncbi:histone deacetylase HDT1-like [Momordica charantia]|uniref:Histone deacetylase HDT1-like n=1 Tax=Momordica charantia TaxID=3673 RepID=A0A6J1CFU4_MOMCH|nr:histone deacetylase HDT1-like [Momordica charantia]